MHLLLAIRVFFAVLFNNRLAERVRTVLDDPAGLDRSETSESASPQTSASSAPAENAIRTKSSDAKDVGGSEKPAPQQKRSAQPPHARSEAVVLLSLLQREGRLVDFFMEPIAEYSDEQIGAAARDLHATCHKVLDRVFGLQPVRSESEGATLEVPSGFDAASQRLVGERAGTGPYRGVLRHAGWKASRCELPQWTGGAEGVWIVAPAEVEVLQ